MKLSNSFAITLLGLFTLAILGWRGADVTMAVVGVVASYVGSRAGQKVGLGVALAKDPNSTLADKINELK